MIMYVGLFGHSAVVFHGFMLFHVFIFYLCGCVIAVFKIVTLSKFVRK